MSDLIRAPWSPGQVAALNEFQRRGGMHPFTCGGDHASPPNLVAREDGWHCPGTYRTTCGYRQDWAHAFMADPAAWPKPIWPPDVHPTSEPYAYQHPSGFTWAESVASHGTGPTAVIDIDIHAPGHDEPVPVEMPLAGARVLHAMLSGVLAEHDDPSDPALREAIAGALRGAAFFCDGECGSDEAACAAAHPIKEAATTHGVISEVYGPIDDIAGVVVGVVQPVIDAERGRVQWQIDAKMGVAGQLVNALIDLEAERTRTEEAEAETKRLTEELAGIRATLDHMSKAMGWISGHDRQGLDHLEEAQHEARSRHAAVKQARQWAGRARAGEALAIAQRKVIERQAREALAATTEPGTPRARRRTVAPTADQPGDGGA